MLLEKTILTGGQRFVCGWYKSQFGSEFNVRLMARSLEIFEHMDEELGYSKEYLELWQGGYLVLAYSEKEFEGLKRNAEVQHRFGLDTAILSPEEVQKDFPRVNIDGVVGARITAGMVMRIRSV